MLSSCRDQALVKIIIDHNSSLQCHFSDTETPCCGVYMGIDLTQEIHNMSLQRTYLPTPSAPGQPPAMLSTRTSTLAHGKITRIWRQAVFSTNLIFTLLLTVLCLGFLVLLPGNSAFAQSDFVTPSQSVHESTPDFSELGSGTFLFKSAGRYYDAIHTNASVSMSISGIVSSVKFTQQFDNNSSNWVEGIYAFPLPENAAVKSLVIKVGEREIQGEIRERQQAKQLYEQAAQDGKIATLVSQRRPNLFSMNVANIGPGETISVQLEYLQTIDFRNDQYSLRLPTTMTPRYINEFVPDPEAIAIPQAHDTDIHSPMISIDVSLKEEAPLDLITSTSHQVSVTEVAGGYDVTLGSTPMNRDFILTWTPLTDNGPFMANYIEELNEDRYSLSVVTPPMFAGDLLGQPRELVLVIDTSGSMSGTSIRSAKSALSAALEGLSANDLFNVIEFNDRTSSVFSSSKLATDRNLASAQRFVRSLRADGGTEMAPAIKFALDKPMEGYLRQVVFVTDGAVGNEDQLFRIIERRINAARLFTVGIGSAPNSYFMTKAAQLGRGTFTYISGIQDVQPEMEKLFMKLESPVLTDLEIEWIGAPADYSPDPLADLYVGEPLVIAAKLDEASSGFVLRGNYGNSLWTREVIFEPANSSESSDSGISTIWAKRKIDTLLDRQRRSHNPEQERDAITRLALAHQLLSPYTSLVAVDVTPVRPQHEAFAKAKVPNLLPQGSNMQPVHMPAGAAGADTLLMLSLLSAMLAVFVWLMQRRLGVTARAA